MLHLRLIVATIGASGVVYGKRLLEVLHSKNIEAHLVISQTAERIIKHELDVENLADYVYEVNDWIIISRRASRP